MRCSIQLSYRAFHIGPRSELGGKDRQAFFPTKHPNGKVGKKEIRIGRSLVLPLGSFRADADPPGTSRLSTGRLHPLAEASGSPPVKVGAGPPVESSAVSSVDLSQSEDIELFTSTSREHLATFRFLLAVRRRALRLPQAGGVLAFCCQNPAIHRPLALPPPPQRDGSAG